MAMPDDGHCRKMLCDKPVGLSCPDCPAYIPKDEQRPNKEWIEAHKEDK